MKLIWRYVNSLNIKFNNKIGIFLTATVFASSLAGLLIWYALHFFTFNTVTWAICFAGYPGFFVGLIGGVIYLYRHEP